MAHIRQSRPDSGRGFQVKGLKTFLGVPSSLGSGGQGRRGYPGRLCFARVLAIAAFFPYPHAAPCPSETTDEIILLRVRVYGLGFREQGLRLRDKGSGFFIQGFGIRGLGV